MGVLISLSITNVGKTVAVAFFSLVLLFSSLRLTRLVLLHKTSSFRNKSTVSHEPRAKVCKSKQRTSGMLRLCRLYMRLLIIINTHGL